MRSKLLIFALVVVAIIGFPFAINGWVCLTTQDNIVTESQMVSKADSFDADCIVVLGAGINYNGTPSAILRDRLDTSIDLYNKGVAPKIVMSGDNSQSSYNEVMAMCNYAISQGVPADDIFCDHAGVNTYNTMFRLRDVFSVKRCVVVTQEYHLYRAIYDAEGLGMSAYGVASDKREYQKIDDYESREFLARIKDFFQVITKPNADKMSSRVSLNQSGTVTQWW